MNDLRHQGIGMTSQRTRDRLIDRLREKGIKNLNLLEVMRSTPRHIFVDEAMATRAYEDTALPIGYSQTISQPYIVARMTELLIESGPCDRVLEIGTGSGYQSAVLAHLVKKLYSVERVPELLKKARQRLRELKLKNISLKVADKKEPVGWPDRGPFDVIMLTAAPENIPVELYEQMALNGRLIAPVGPAGQQELVIITKTETGFDKVVIEKVSFVPLIEGSE